MWQVTNPAQKLGRTRAHSCCNPCHKEWCYHGKVVGANEELNCLDLRILCVPKGVVTKLKQVQVNAASGKNVEVGVVKAITKRPDLPGEHVARMIVGRDETSVGGIILISLVDILNRVWDMGLVKVMVLPTLHQ